MTELLPNSIHPGIDSEYEWVEITNLGSEPASTRGLQLIDNSEPTPLGERMIPPGQPLVIAAPLADTGSAALVDRVATIGNGLSNSGDRLALHAADGSLVDALSYGDDHTFADPAAPIRAPNPGQSIVRRFGPDGALIDVGYLDVPQPGIVTMFDPNAPPPWETGDEDGAPATGNDLTTAEPAPASHTEIWFALLLAATGVLGGVVVHRAVAIGREWREASADAVDGDATAEGAGAGAADPPASRASAVATDAQGRREPAAATDVDAYESWELAIAATTDMNGEAAPTTKTPASDAPDDLDPRGTV